MILQAGQRACGLLLKLLFGIIIVPMLLCIAFFLVCGLAPSFIFLISIMVFIVWGSQWTFVAWFFAGVVIWCGIAHYVVMQKMKKEQRISRMTKFFSGIGWFFALAGVLLFLAFYRIDWSVGSAIVCETGSLACWYLVERNQKKRRAQTQFLAILQRHTQAELQRVGSTD